MHDGSKEPMTVHVSVDSRNGTEMILDVFNISNTIEAVWLCSRIELLGSI